MKNKILNTFILILFLLISCEKNHLQKPNIIYILADDLGYGDIKAFNIDGKIKTPQIDKLAKDGIKFTDAHTSSSVCTPTRYGILTGRYNWRSRLKRSVLSGTSNALITKDRTTVASFLKQNGYLTGFIGKWHLGWNWSFSDTIIHYDSNPDQTKKTFYGFGEKNHSSADRIDFSKKITNSPNDLGFDYSFGHSGSLDMPPYVYVENEITTAKINRFTFAPKPYSWWRYGPTASDFDHDDVTPNFFEKAKSFIRNAVKKNKPFFLYLPLPSPHTPILPLTKWQGKSGLNSYADFVMQIDNHIGELDTLLEELKISNNTIIIFTSDNGCSPEANFNLLSEKGHHPSGKFRGHKADIFEGGHRVPFIIKWPKKIQAGSSSDKIICTTDLIATCAEILNIKLDQSEGVDSFSMVPLFSKETQDNFERSYTIHHSINGSFAIRKGMYKFIFCPGSGGWSIPKPSQNETKNLPKFQLYNLDNDPSESNNLYGKLPELEDELIAIFKNAITNGRTTDGDVQKNFPTNRFNEKWEPLAIFSKD